MPKLLLDKSLEFKRYSVLPAPIKVHCDCAYVGSDLGNMDRTLVLYLSGHFW